MRPRASVEATASKLPEMAIPPNKLRSLPARSTAARAAVLRFALCLALDACSSLPERAWPPRVVGELEVEFHFGPQSERAIPMPESDARLTLFELHTHDKDVREEFRAGQRFWIVPATIDVLHVHCSYRVFGPYGRDAIAAAVDPQQLFPGSTVIRHDARSDGDPSR